VLLTATEYPAVPLPLPLAPDVTVIQGLLLKAVQPQPPGATTLTPALPPLDSNRPLVGDIENVQAWLACVTVKV